MNNYTIHNPEVQGAIQDLNLEKVTLSIDAQEIIKQGSIKILNIMKAEKGQASQRRAWTFLAKQARKKAVESKRMEATKEDANWAIQDFETWWNNIADVNELVRMNLQGIFDPGYSQTYIELGKVGPHKQELPPVPSAEILREHITIDLSVDQLITIHGNLCLALRHPGNNGECRKMALSIVKQFGDILVDVKALDQEQLKVIERTENIPPDLHGPIKVKEHDRKTRSKKG